MHWCIAFAFQVTPYKDYCVYNNMYLKRYLLKMFTFIPITAYNWDNFKIYAKLVLWQLDKGVSFLICTRMYINEHSICYLIFNLEISLNWKLLQVFSK